MCMGSAGSWCPLLGHVHTSSDLADREAFFYSLLDPKLAKSPTRLCHGLSSGPCQNATVHVAAKGIQARRSISKNACSQVSA